MAPETLGRRLVQRDVLALEIRRNSVTLAELDDLVAYLKNFD